MSRANSDSMLERLFIGNRRYTNIMPKKAVGSIKPEGFNEDEYQYETLMA
jgi:hypothetical protein